MLEFNNKDMNLLILLSEIATIEQLARTKLDSALPKDLNISSFSVLNHFSGTKSEKTPLQLARSFHVTKGAMTNTLTTDIKGTIKQIQSLEDAGADIVRVSCPDEESSKSLKEISLIIELRNKVATIYYVTQL